MPQADARRSGPARIARSQAMLISEPVKPGPKVVPPVQPGVQFNARAGRRSWGRLAARTSRAGVGHGVGVGKRRARLQIAETGAP